MTNQEEKNRGFKVKQEPPCDDSSDESPKHSIEVILDIKKEMNVSDLMSRSPGPAASSLAPNSDSNITLWQFLLELLQQEQNGDIIEWTRGAEGEFRLIDAEAVARKWGQRKAKPHMNYDKLSRALRYYYEKNIIKKVIGKKFVYRFVTDPNAAAEYQHLKQCYIKDEKDASHDIPSYLPQITNQKPDFSALSLIGTDSPTTAHSVSTPSPSDSVCSPSSSVASTTTVNHSSSPTPSTSSPVEETGAPVRQTRKRSLSPCTSSATTTYSLPLTTASSSKNEHPPPPVKKGMKPNPLNLTATSNFVVPPISPLLMLQHQNSPLFQSSLGQLYAIASASLASAGLYGSQMSPLLAAQSPFRSPLTTPKNFGVTGSVASESGLQSRSSTDSQVFQFPPVTAFQANPLMNTFTNLISPMAPFMMSSQSSTSFKFPSTTDSLKTPTVPIKMPTL